MVKLETNVAGIRKSQYYNLGPPVSVPSGAPKDAVKAEFARRLQRMMAEAGLNQTEAARLATKHMPVDQKTGKHKEFTRDNMSNYVRGVVLPRPDMLHALCALFDCKPEDLIPSRGVPNAGDNAPPLDFRDIGGGRVWLRINQTVEYPVALKIVALLNEETISTPASSARK